MNNDSSPKTNESNYDFAFPLFIFFLFLVFAANQYFVKQKYASYTGETTATLVNVEDIYQYFEGIKSLQYYKVKYAYQVNQIRYTKITKVSKAYQSNLESLMEEPTHCVQVNYDPENPKNSFLDLGVNWRTLDCGN